MTEFPRFGPAPKLADAAVIRRLDINDIATMRRLHVSSFARLAGPTYTEFETRAVVSMLLADTYSDARYAAMSRGCILGAEYQGRLVGTVEWTDPSSPNAAVAINQLFVDPLFT
ncbi:MAG TPA: hypothetical protein VMX97_05980, partial [Hyphomicrobiaceae bacterium]|nr:hypothetical protein [Hyphomicrobiaceae bacterium]